MARNAFKGVQERLVLVGAVSEGEWSPRSHRSRQG